jgi:copper transport protein
MDSSILRWVVCGVAGMALAACIALVAWAPPAQAHASLSSSMPAANASVAVSPAQIILTFTEPVDARLSRVVVVDVGARVVPGAGLAEAVPGKPAELLVPVAQTLRTGVYSVNWRSVSSSDGHVETGAFAFGVRAVPAPGSVVTVSLATSSPWLQTVSAAGRWLLYVGLALLVGGAGVVWLVFGGKVPAGGLKIMRAGVILAAAGVVALVGAERSLAGAPSLLPLFVTREGQYLLALGAAVVASGLAVAALDLWPGRAALAAVGVTAAVAVLAHVLAGHAAVPATLRPLNILAQWVHMTAIGVWAGGLAWLLLGIRGAEPDARARAVRTYSRIATVTLVVVLATGILRAVIEIGPLSNLVTTAYGVTLLVKIGLVAILMGFAALNHYRFVPRMDRDQWAVRSFLSDSRAELAVMAFVLVATALLTGLAPAKSAPPTASAGSPDRAVAVAKAPAPPLWGPRLPQ